MRYTIMGFSQKKAYELKLTPKELVFLRWFIDFMVTLRMRHIVVDKITYFWVDRKTVIEDLPILGISDPSHIRRFLQGLEKKQLLRHFVRRGKEAYYGLNHEIMTELLSFAPAPRSRHREKGAI